MNSNFLRIKLADSYSAIGKTSTAHIQYQKLLNELKEYDTYTGLIKTIINKCEELTECECRKCKKHIGGMSHK